MAPRLRDSIGLYWTDEAIIMSLEGMEKGSPIPENVSVDVNPYQYKPSYLPDDIWYLLRSDHNKNSEHGFWRARGEASEIFMNSAIIGWRTTLEFYEGQGPHRQRTDWVMQEYRITRKALCSYSNPKESSLLCRVFLSSGASPKQEMKLNLGGKEITGGNHIHPKPSVVPESGSTTGQRRMSESQARNRDDNTGPLAVPRGLPIIPFEDMDDDDCISRGDYLELDDLVDGESKSSSSDNSSCVTPTSDEFFDSLALLRDLGAKVNRDEKGKDGKDGNVKFSVATSIKPNEVVMRPANLGSLVKNDGSQSPAKAIDKKFLDKKVPENAIRSKKARKSNSHNVATSSRSHKAIPRGDKKAVAGRAKKLKKYLCFMPF